MKAALEPSSGEPVSGDGKVWQGPNQVPLAHRLAVLCLVGFSCSHGRRLKLFPVYTEIRKSVEKKLQSRKLNPRFLHI